MKFSPSIVSYDFLCIVWHPPTFGSRIRKNKDEFLLNIYRLTFKERLSAYHHFFHEKRRRTKSFYGQYGLFVLRFYHSIPESFSPSVFLKKDL
jgi:hypothetical protein